MRKIAVLFLVLILAQISCGKKTQNANNNEKLVEVCPVKIGVMEKSLTYTGSLESLEKVMVSSKVAGRVLTVYFREGDRVKAGDLLIKLEDQDLRAQFLQAEAALQMAKLRLSQAKSGLGLQNTASSTQIQQAQNALDQAQANWELARKDLERMENLYRQGAVSRQTLDQVTTQEKVAREYLDSAQEGLKLANANSYQDQIRKEDIKVAQAGISQAEAALMLAKAQLDYTFITSPISGVVIRRTVEPGEMVFPAMGSVQPLLEIVNNQNLTVEIAVPEKELKLFKVGNEVEVKVDTQPEANFSGKVEKIIPALDSRTQAFRVKIALQNPGELLKAGSFARVIMRTYYNPRAVLVPRESVVKRNGINVVFVVEENKARMLPVTIGIFNEQNYEVKSGLKGGEMLVIAGQSVLNDQDQVKLQKGVSQ